LIVTRNAGFFGMPNYEDNGRLFKPVGIADDDNK
jgi:hypothetical protein